MEKKSYNFSSITFSELESMVDIQPKLDFSKFEEWFSFSYPMSNMEVSFLENLIQKNRLFLPSYQEDDLKMKFLSPIFNQVDFFLGNFRDWYHTSLSGTLNGVKIKGFTDFMVAKGTITPKKPYFFIQEFKPSIPDGNPEYQLLAEMLIAIEKTNIIVLRGGYIIGRNWYFVILEKIAKNKFEYFVSQQFDSLDLANLKQIYVNLQAVKLKYCQD